MPDSEYRFLPWARRGLAAALADQDPGGSAPINIRAGVHIDVDITNAGSGGVDLTLVGPGEVIGIDPRIIVRADPRPNSTNFEPNYLVAIEFDPPDFPWMFTPAAPRGSRLRPWLVLVVVERTEGITTKYEAGVPLPVLQIKNPAVAGAQLPNLADSWMWAHGQALMGEGDSTPIPNELAAHPNTNVSRLVCPRRLRPGAQYAACLVPAFAAGRDRGLGIAPDPTAKTTAPAWTADQSDLRLPIYYHWDFATGPAGDFEALAERLHPFPCPPTVGFVKMHIGAAGPGLALPPDADDSIVDMDGALRAPQADDGKLAEIPAALQDDLTVALDAANAHATTDGDVDAPPVGPPIYGEWHAARHTIPADGQGPRWLRELNLDPRTRVSGGLGAEIVRRNQEEFMQKAWEQVGRVLEANRLLNTARLALEAARRIHARDIASLPWARSLQLTAPLHARVLFDAVALPVAIHKTSLPDATTDAAMRRLLSPQRSLMKNAARTAGVEKFTPGLVGMLAAGTESVDPGRFVPDGVLRLQAMDGLEIPADGADVSLAALGIDATLPASRVRVASDQSTRALATATAGPLQLTVRTDLRSTGMVTKAHLDALGGLVANDGELRIGVDRLVAASDSRHGATGLLVTRDDDHGIVVDALDVDTAGTISVRRPPHLENVAIGTVDTGLASTRGGLSGVLTRLPAGTLDRHGVVPVDVRLGPTTAPIVTHPAAGLGDIAASNTVPLLVTDAAVITAFETAFATTAANASIGIAPPTREVIAFDIANVGAHIVARTDPDRTVRPRVASMLNVAGKGLIEALGSAVAPTFDRVMAYPEFAMAAYRYLVDYDQQRFCPGIDVVPPDSVTLLETNPRFIEAFMVGLNHEMNREMLWRAYPCDLRATSFQRFWDRLDGQLDIPPIHTFNGAAGVGKHTADGKPKLVFLVRGELLRRYPTAVVYAIPAVRTGGKLRMTTDTSLIKRPIFHGWFDPDATFYGFELVDTDLDSGDGWFFVLQQQPTEPRFGLDDPADPARQMPITKWDDAAWSDAGVDPDQHLGAATLGAVALPMPDDAGAVASALYQRPVLVAVHGKYLVQRP